MSPSPGSWRAQGIPGLGTTLPGTMREDELFPKLDLEPDL